MKREKMTNKLFSLSCENQPGVLTRIITAFTRPGYEIATLSQCATDVDGIVLITLEAAIPGIKVDNMLSRLGKIIGVLDVQISFGAVPRAAVYRVDIEKSGRAIWSILQRHHTQTIMLHDGHLLVQQLAAPANIQKLFNALDGPGLAGFCQLPVPVAQPISWEEVNGALSDLAGAKSGSAQVCVDSHPDHDVT